MSSTGLAISGEMLSLLVAFPFARQSMTSLRSFSEESSSSYCMTDKGSAASMAVSVTTFSLG